MKNIFVFPVILILIGSNIFAQKYESKTSSIAERIFLNNRSGIDEASVGHHPHPRNMGFQQAVQLKSAQTIKQRLDSIEYLEWNDTTKLWTTYGKRIYSYTSVGSLTQTVEHTWDGANYSWMPDWKFEYTYNESGNVTQYLGFDWDKENNNWISDWKNVYSYDSDGTVPQILDYDWDKITNNWVLVWQYLYSYNENGNVDQILDYYWDEDTSMWVLAWKYVCTYDANKNLAQMLGYFMDDNTSQWVLDSNEEYIFDEKGNNIKYIANTRNETTGQLELYFKREYTYDNNYTFNDLISPLPYLWQVNYYNHMLTGQSTSIWNKSSSKWEVPIYKALYYYSEQNTTSVTGLNQNQFNIYPNPVTEYVQFDFQNINSEVILELFDIHGRKLLSKTIDDNEKVNMKRFRSGTYIYKLNIDGKIQSGKLVKE